MEILGIGPMELMLVLIIALMVFGPDRLPTIGAKLGRAMRDMRRATRAISEEISATRAAIEAPAKELAEPFQEVADVAKSTGVAASTLRNPGEAIRQSVLKELNAPPKAEQASPPPPENTIAPPDLMKVASPEAANAPPSAAEIAELPDASPSEPADLTAESDSPRDSTDESQAHKEQPQEVVHRDQDETPSQSTDAAPYDREQ